MINSRFAEPCRVICKVLTLLILTISCARVKTLSPEKAKKILAQENGLEKLIDHYAKLNLVNNKVLGMVVAVTTPEGGVQYFSYGYSERDKSNKMQTDALFQIGSITKLFTASLMTVLEDEKILDSKSTIGSFMGPKFKPRTEWVKNITIESLATHSSGLPAEYQDLKMLRDSIQFLFTGENIWRNLEEKELWEFVETFNFGYQEAPKYRYSNVAYVFLGGILGRVVPNADYETLLLEKITTPLGLTDTVFVLNEEQKSRMATGYSGSAPPFMKRGIRMPPWDFQNGLNAAGGLYSSAKDLMTFLKVNMEEAKTPLAKSLKKTQEKKVKFANGHLGLAWFLETLPESHHNQVYINGIISGYTSYVGFDPITQVGVVVLQNTMNMNYEFGEKLLDRLVLCRK